MHSAEPNLTKMTKVGFLRLSYEKQDTLLKLLILSMAAVLCKTSNQKYLLSSSEQTQNEPISVSAFSTRLFSVLRFESVIHEFDP